MNSISRIILSVLILAAPLSQAAAQTGPESGKWSYVPDFHGTLRAFYRNSTPTGQSRFEIANARLSVGGYVMPWLDYYIQTDFCAGGEIKILDAYASVRPAEGLRLMLGQMRVPLCVEATRAPHQYYFADVALVTLFGNLRSVGFKAGYTVPGTKLYFEGGIFNASDMTRHTTWNRAMTYSVKANWTTPCGLKPEIGFMSRVPGGYGNGVRLNQYDASLSWTHGRFFAEAECLWRLYAGADRDASYAFNVFASYGIPVKWRMADQLSVQARFDMIDDASNGVYDDSHHITTTIPARRRVTVGVTASRNIGKLSAHFRINYEQYFYDRGMKAPSLSEDNELVAGVMLHF